MDPPTASAAVIANDELARSGVGWTETVDRGSLDATVESFVVEHYDRLLGLARLVCRDAADASDAVQVALEHAWRARAKLRATTTLRPWLDRIVVREAVRVAQRRKSWLGRIFTQRPDVAWIEPMDRGPEAATYAGLRQAYSRLSPVQRAVVALHLHLGYTIAETAVIVGAPEETVRSRLRLAKERLRQDLQEVK